MVNYSYWLWDNAIPKSVCEAVIKDINWGDSEKGTVGLKDGSFGIDEVQRETDVVWHPPLSVMGCIIQTYMEKANELADWNYSLTAMDDVQIGRYGLKGHYDWHRDVFSPLNGVQRKLSCSVLLNDVSEFKGGDLELENVSKQPSLQQGSVIVFPSFVKHKVNPIIEGVRYSAVAWYSGPSFR